MVQLEKSAYPVAFAAYRSQPYFFPLIGAALEGHQDGVVLADDDSAPTQFYVEHAFGFAQCFGAIDAGFEAALERHLLIERRFAAPKARLYTPHCPAFLAGPSADPLRSWRQRFTLDAAATQAAITAAGTLPADIDVQAANTGNVADIDRLFGVVTRFWRSADDFVEGALAQLVLHRGQPASLCYAAAVSGGGAEIDVLTLPEFRTLGLGKVAVQHFVTACAARGVAPLWDCFTNNTGSMQLCQSVGFRAPREPYPFFTINKTPG